MSDITTAPSSPHSRIARSNCDPLWIHHQFLASGHNASRPNGTGTYIRRNGQKFLVTCKHVLSAVSQGEMLSLIVGRAVLRFGSVTPEGFRTTFRTDESSDLDIAISPVTEGYADLLETRKGKLPINLDQWVEPDWEDCPMMIANGYPTEHKNEIGDQIAAPMISATAEVASRLGGQEKTFVLHSFLEVPHNAYLSGMSGGPVYVPVSESELTPTGIIFEGGPSSKDSAQESIYSGPNSIFIRAYMLSPSIFDEWLDRCGLS